MSLEKSENQASKDVILETAIQKGITQANLALTKTRSKQIPHNSVPILSSENIAVSEEAINYVSSAEIEITLKFTDSQGEMLNKLTSALALSSRVVLGTMFASTAEFGKRNMG